jgi:hypothetical protein
MVAKRKTKQPARRKAAEDDEVDRDLTNMGNPQELEHGGDAGDQIIKEEWEPLGSAMEAGKAYANLKAIKDYFSEGGEGDLSKMDHPGMRDGLKDFVSDGGPLDGAMQHVKDLVQQHHGESAKDMDADAMMEKLCKSVEQIDGSGPAPYDDPPQVTNSVEQLENDAPTTGIGKDDSFEQGEANLVDSGVIPEGDLEPLDEDKQHGSDADTEEILERYQKGGRWHTRVVGEAWRAKNGRIYVKKRQTTYDELNNGDRFNLVSKPAITWQVDKWPVSISVAGPSVGDKRSFDRKESVISPPTSAKCSNVRKISGDDCDGEDNDDPECSAMFNALDHGKSLTNEGNPAELVAPTDTGAIIKDEHLDAIGKAADHLDAMGNGYSAAPETHKDHADALREVHRDLTNMGNPDELEGPHKDGPGGPTDDSDLTAGVEELKDMDDEESKASTKSKKQLSPNVTRAINELRQGDAELRRFVRLNGIPVN